MPSRRHAPVPRIAGALPGVVLLALATPVAAQEVVERVIRAPTERPVAELLEPGEPHPPQDLGERLDHWHDGLFRGVQGFVERTDHRFARDGGVRQPVPVAPFRLGAETEWREDAGGGLDFTSRLDFDILLRLPNIERRLRLFVTSEDVREAPDVTTRRDNTLRAGLRYSWLRALDFDVGLRLDFPETAFASLRWQRLYRAGDVDVQPFLKLYAESGDGLGTSGGLTVDRWRDAWLLRSATFVDWRDRRSAAEWTQTFVAARVKEVLRFGRYGPIVQSRDLTRGSGLQLLASGRRLSSTDVYEASLFTKFATRRGWLYWYVTPLVRWERSEGWKGEPGFRIGFDALFWDLADRSR